MDGLIEIEERKMSEFHEGIGEELGQLACVAIAWGQGTSILRGRKKEK